ncbi:MAG: aminotransferase class V-fold PLP-dependent enzyme [Acidobacteria bacterium]|nr:aminotransferase class V-fold PLP-dependent enzyme [Acidobacteriota bacterium]
MSISRRWLLKGMSLGTLMGALPSLVPTVSARRGPTPYEQLGIRPVINFLGTMTTIGASKMWDDLHEAANQASREYVVLEELKDKIGERLAALIGCEDALVTTGAAGAIGLGTCATLTGTDRQKIRDLPDLPGPRPEVVIQKVHRTGYDHAVRSTGAKLVEVETEEELVAAINERTTMMFFLGGTSGDWRRETPVSLERCLGITRRAGVPLMVDAANMLPPWGNIRRLASQGVDLICISGGKHMRGPQCSGILAGRRDLIQAAWLNSSPHADSHGRPMKVGREEMVTAWLTVEKYSRLDFEAIDRECVKQAEYIERELAAVPGLRLQRTPVDRTRNIRRVMVQWDEDALGITGADVDRLLMAGEPRIAVGRVPPQGIELTVFMNDPGDEKIAVQRLKEVFRKRG